MPGYGFAARSQGEIDQWQSMITDYFEHRENLVGIVLIMDIRRKWQEEEEWIKQWCEKLDLQVILALNKADKLSRSEQMKHLKSWRGLLPSFSIHAVSSLKNHGVKELEEDIFRMLVR